MKIGEIVRLKHPFKPASESSQAYGFGIVIGLVWDDLQNDNHSELAEIILQLYDPDRSAIYVDETGIAAIYSFYPSEINV